MTNHLAECLAYCTCEEPALCMECICDALRACEQRIRDEEIVKYARKVAAERRKAFYQAEMAITKVKFYIAAIGTGDEIPERAWIDQEKATDAIRALREEQ